MTHDGIGCIEPQDNCICSKEDSCEMSGTSIRRLEVYLLAATPWEHTPEFEPNEQTAEREDEA